MEKIVTRCLWLVAAVMAMVLGGACSAEPTATDLEFSYNTFDYTEGEEGGYVSVYLMESPYKYPVVVSMEVEMLTGKNNIGEELVIEDVLTFNTTDQSYTITQTGPRTAKIENVEVTYTNYSSKVYFDCHDNNFLQGETITLEFRLLEVDGSEMGSMTTTVVTIVDDEKAPRLKSGYYHTTYNSPAEAQRPQKDEFYLSLHKVDKYSYVASGWFGMERPRLVGVFDPEAKTLTFDGTDYDHTLWALENPVNAFQNDTIWAYNYANGAITQVLRLRGTQGAKGEQIVLSTEAIAQDATGVVLAVDSECGFDIYNFNAASNSTVGLVGIYDAMEHSNTMEFSTTNYPTEQSGTKVWSPNATAPTPFGNWVIEE